MLLIVTAIPASAQYARVLETQMLAYNSSTSAWEYLDKGAILGAIEAATTITGGATGIAFTITRDEAAADSGLGSFTQDNASDDEILLLLDQDGTGDILSCVDGDTERLELADGGLFTLTAADGDYSLKVDGDAMINGKIVYITGVGATLNGGYYVYVEEDSGAVFTVAEDGNTTVAGTLAVTGASTFASTVGITGNLAVNTTAFTVAASSGNTSVGGTLAVAGTTTLGGVTTINGAVDLNGGLDVLNNVIIHGTTTLSDTIRLTGATDCASTLNADGDFTINTNKVTIAGATGAYTGGDAADITLGAGSDIILDANTGNITSLGNVTAATGTIAATTTTTEAGDHVLDSGDYGTIVIYTANAAIAVTLPANAAPAGSTITCICTVNNAAAITYSSATVDTLITFNDATADSVAFADGHRIGSKVKFISDGAKWMAFNESANNTMTVGT